MIHDIRSWDWFLEEHKEDSDEDGDEIKRPKEKQKGSTSKSGKDTAKSYAMDVDVEDGNETDEMLDGFIVDDEDVGEEIDNGVDEEADEDDEEEEFEEDEDDECSIYFPPHASLLSETRTIVAISSYIEDIDIVNDDIEMSGVQDDFVGHNER
ncbi:hypothetical protein Tco_0930900, partial [Tanacetum coccineum]